MECQYVATQRGGIALVFEGHRYNKVRDGKDGTVYWRCSRDRQCPGRAVTVNNRVKKANNKHNHPAEAGIGGLPGSTGSGSLGLLRNGGTTTGSGTGTTTGSSSALSLYNSQGRESRERENTNNHHSHHPHHPHHHHSSSNRHHHHHSTHHHHHHNNNSNQSNNNNSNNLNHSGNSKDQPLSLSTHHHTSGSSSSAGLSPPSSSGPLLSEISPIIAPRVPTGLTIQEVLNAQTAAAATAAVSFPTLMQETLKYIAFASGNHQIASFAASMANNFACPTIENIERSLCRNMFNNEASNYYSDSSEDQPLNMSMRNSGQLLKRVRSLLKSSSISNETLSAFIISSGNAHQSEYIADHDDRIPFISGFTGSYSTSVITLDDAALWTDGRYFLQAEKELFPGWILMKQGLPGTPSPGEWMNKVLPTGSRVGCDPYLASSAQWTDLAKTLSQSNNHLIPVTSNPIDLIWEDRPPPPSNPIEPYPTSFAGKSWQEKIEEVRKEMIKKDANALVLTALDDVAWLLNLRGSDIAYNPVFFAYIVVTMDVVHFFVDESKLDSQCRKHLNLEATTKPKIELREYKLISDFLKWLVAQDTTSKIWISSSSSHALVSLVPESRRIDSPNPVILSKAIKNKVEIECMKRAHIKDAVALCEFFAWLEDEIVKGDLDEVKAANKLETFRKTQEDYVGPSFETISASGPNGAIIHYRPEPETARPLSVNEMYLCDTGAQFRDGTTDVTRTLHFGQPTSFERECFTRVLKGHIDLALAHFPVGIKGNMLDSFARRHLWEVGLDYLHGTGHGVGVYLNVHEGPMGISYKPNPNDPGLKEGMILSNEPGYYEDGKFGIRIESLVLAKKVNLEHNFKDRGYLGFETITLVPIQTKLLEPSLLSMEEIEWLDNYHATCREVIGKALKEQGKTNAYCWLMKETQPLG